MASKLSLSCLYFTVPHILQYVEQFYVVIKAFIISNLPRPVLQDLCHLLIFKQTVLPPETFLFIISFYFFLISFHSEHAVIKPKLA